MISIMVANKFVNKKNVLITLSALLMCLGSNNAHSQAKGPPKVRPEATESATKKKTTDAEGKTVEFFKGDIETPATGKTSAQILGRGKEATHSTPVLKAQPKAEPITPESMLGEAPATNLSSSQLLELSSAMLKGKYEPAVIKAAEAGMKGFTDSLTAPDKGGIEANDNAIQGLAKIQGLLTESLSNTKNTSKEAVSENLPKAIEKFVTEQKYTNALGQPISREAAIQALAKKEGISIEEATRKIDEQIKAEKDQLCKCAGCRV